MDNYKPAQHRAIEVDAKEFELDTAHEHPDRYVSLLIGSTVFDLIAAYSIIDGTTAGAQVRAALDAYDQLRRQDPTLPEKIEDSKERLFNT